MEDEFDPKTGKPYTGLGKGRVFLDGGLHLKRDPEEDYDAFHLEPNDAYVHTDMIHIRPILEGEVRKYEKSEVAIQDAVSEKLIAELQEKIRVLENKTVWVNINTMICGIAIIVLSIAIIMGAT